MSDTIQHGAVSGTDDEQLRAAINEVADLQDTLVAELVGLGTTMCAAMDALPGFVPCGHAFGVVIEGLSASAGKFDPAYLREVTEAVRARSEHVSAHRGVEQGKPVAVRASLPAGEFGAMHAVLLVALQGIAPYAMRAMELGVMNDDLDVAIARALAVLGRDDASPADLHANLAGLGEAARTALTMSV